MNDYSKLKGHKGYHKIYAAYVTDPPGKLVTDAGVTVQGKRVLDLCCGRGDLALWAKTHGATDVMAVDACGSMIDKSALAKAGIECRTSHAQTMLASLEFLETFDLIACRQAVNYWLVTRPQGMLLARALSAGGQFVFNTFTHKPESKPRVIADYELNGLKYLEISYSCPVKEGHFPTGSIDISRVIHLQCCEGEDPHETRFYWLPEDSLRGILSPWFDLKVINRGRSATWVCTKK